MPRNLAELLQDKFGTKATPFKNRLGVATIGLSAVKIYGNDPTRFVMEFFNLSASNIYLLDDPSVSATKGILCGPNGGSVVLLWEEDFELVAGEFWAIGAGAALSYLAYEIVAGGA